MEELLSYLGQFGFLSREQALLIQASAQTLVVPKGSYFSEAGKVPNRIAYILSGVLRACYYNRNGEDFTRYFLYEGRFISDINNFRNRTAPAEYIEALTACRLVVFSRESYDKLATVIPVWDDLFSGIISGFMENKMKASSNMLPQDAQTRYLQFLEHYPGLANRVPLSTLASYLGITPSSLSRIRKKIS